MGAEVAGLRSGSRVRSSLGERWPVAWPDETGGFRPASPPGRRRWEGARLTSLSTRLSGPWSSLASATRSLKPWGATALVIEHIGSTAVPEAAAKSTIDIAVGVGAIGDLVPHRGRLEALG